MRRGVQLDQGVAAVRIAVEVPVAEAPADERMIARTVAVLMDCHVLAALHGRHLLSRCNALQRQELSSQAFLACCALPGAATFHVSVAEHWWSCIDPGTVRLARFRDGVDCGH